MKSNDSLVTLVEEIKTQIESNGTSALFEFNKKFDNYEGPLRVDSKELKKSYERLDKTVVNSISIAAQQIRNYHEKIAPKSEIFEDRFGVKITRKWTPYNPVGLYIPGGNYPLFSSLLMTAIPAQVADCKNIIACTPPSRNSDLIFGTAYFLGITEIYQLGGAQAILAMALGTDQISKCRFIAGPGNRYVTAAKEYIRTQFKNVSIDLPAGPSEIFVVADGSIPASYSASDLLSQAEHDPSSKSYLAGTIENKNIIEKIESEFWKQVQNLKLRDKINPDQLIINIVDTETDLIELVNQTAPEHLAVHTVNPINFANQISTAGSIFIGPWTAETFGDYLNGPSHVLPTNGYGAVYAGLSTSSFGKYISIQETSLNAFKILGPVAIQMAQAEGLIAHANAIEVRNA